MQKLHKAIASTRGRPYVMLAILLLIFGGGAWAYFGSRGDKVETLIVKKAPFEVHVLVSGKVVSGHDADLGFSQTGRVQHVYAKVGQKVAAGALLAETENGELVAAVLQKQAKLTALKEGTRPEELAIKETAVTNANAALLAAVRDAFRASDAAVHNDADQLFSNPRTMPFLNFSTGNSQLTIDLIATRGTIEPMLYTWQQDVDRGVADAGTLASRAQENLVLVNDFLEKCSAALNSATQNSSVTAAMIAEYSSDIASARGAINAAATGITADNAIRLSAEKDLALAQAGSRDTDIAAAEADVMSAQAQLIKTRINAPFTGTVTRIDVEQGEVAQGGSSSMTMIGGAFQIEAYIPEVEIASIKLADKASTYLDAYGSSVPFDAVIVSINPAETAREGISTYKTMLQFTEPDDRIRSGMTANISIITEYKADTLVIPLGAIVKKDGANYVYVMVGSRQIERPVTIGLSSLGQVEMVSGLTEGDVLVLNP